MIHSKQSGVVLKAAFRKKVVAELPELKAALQTSSTMSVFRHLKPLGYMTSFSHRGRFYVLKDSPSFDEHGLWFYHGIGFSQCGTLRNTLVHLIDSSRQGMSTDELGALTMVRVYDALVWLVRKGKVDRVRLDGPFLYVSAVPEKKDAQLVFARQDVALRHKSWNQRRGKGSRRRQVMGAALQSVQHHLDVHELAQELGIKPEDLVQMLQEMGIEVGTART